MWKLFITEEGGMGERSATTPEELRGQLDTPFESERAEAKVWAKSSSPGDEFEFANGVVVHVTGNVS